MENEQEDPLDIRFEMGNKDAVEFMELVRAKWFDHLKSAKIIVLFDLKKRMKGRKLVMGRIMKANDLIRRLTVSFAPNGCDYVLFLDKIAFTMVMTDLDKKRLVRHELRHCIYNPDASNPWQILDHDIEDFEEEIRLNVDNPGWAKRVVQVTLDIYAQQKEEQKEKVPGVPPAGRVVRMRKAANG
jgi:hypothetical protein